MRFSIEIARKFRETSDVVSEIKEICQCRSAPELLTISSGGGKQLRQIIQHSTAMSVFRRSRKSGQMDCYYISVGTHELG